MDTSDLMNMFSTLNRRNNAPFDPTDPRRRTPSGELRMPKFVKFAPEDSGDLVDEIIWEGTPHQIHCSLSMYEVLNLRTRRSLGLQAV